MLVYLKLSFVDHAHGFWITRAGVVFRNMQQGGQQELCSRSIPKLGQGEARTSEAIDFLVSQDYALKC